MIFVSDSFTKAIDAAFIEMTDDEEFIDSYRNIGLIYPIPECVDFFAISDYPYPKTFDFNHKEETFTMCYQANAGSPRQETHELVAKTLVRLLNKRYKINLNYAIQQYDTNRFGYFDTLKNAVDSGDCHVAVATTIIDNIRSPKVRFQCPYESSSQGFLRSNLDSHITINNFNDLNRTDIVVGVSSGTFYENFIPQISAATIVRDSSGTQGVFKLVNENKVHAVLADINDLIFWLRNGTTNCTDCFVKGFGQPVYMASFTTKKVLKTSEASKIITMGSIIAYIFITFILTCF
ncbi:hypothetical protein ABK040_010448 [Willaertia magna]